MEPSGTVRISDARFFAHHGTTKKERDAGAHFSVDVSMDLCFIEAAKNDDLLKTADYELAYRIVEEVMTQNRWKLIERIAYHVGQLVLERCTVVERVEVAVRKLNPPVGGACGASEAIYRATRS